jgi:hypothetical protein
VDVSHPLIWKRLPTPKAAGEHREGGGQVYRDNQVFCCVFYVTLAEAMSIRVASILQYNVSVAMDFYLHYKAFDFLLGCYPQIPVLSAREPEAITL